MLHALAVWLVALATGASGLLAGISLDKSLVQLPARKRLGLVAYAAYSRAADLGRGLIWYPLLGVGAPALILLATAIALLQRLPFAQVWPLYLAASLGVAHLFTTSRAAPVLLNLRRGEQDSDALQRLFQRFAVWQAIRCVLQVATFLALLWTLVVVAQ